MQNEIRFILYRRSFYTDVDVSGPEVMSISETEAIVRRSECFDAHNVRPTSIGWLSSGNVGGQLPSVFGTPTTRIPTASPNRT